MNKIDSLINEIQLLRVNILPPYTYDEDECEKSIESYIDFYKEIKISNCIESTKTYLSSLERFSINISNDDFFDQLITARKSFIESFPFCFDELNDVSNNELPTYVNVMRKTYSEDIENPFLIQNIKKYLEILNNLKDRV